MSETISLRIPREVLERLDDLAEAKKKERSTLMREILDQGIREGWIDEAVERYRRGEVTGWRAAELAGISLRRFYEALQQRGVLLQYGEHDLEEDLKALRGE